MQKPIISAADAAGLVQSGWTITTGGFGSTGHPEALTEALRDRFLSDGTPVNINLVFSAGQGDKKDRGLNKIALPGLIKRVIGGYWALTPKLGDLAQKNLIEAYNFPQGIISNLFRAIASGRSGVISKIGLNTWIDPRCKGGKLNTITNEHLIDIVTLRGNEQLFYPSFPIDCAFLRGTISDEDGNISMRDEASFHDSLSQAQAVRNSGGIVIVQVIKIAPSGSLSAQEIKIPGIFVDYIVLANPSEHWQTYGERFNADFTGAIRGINKKSMLPSKVSAKSIIAKRALFEINGAKNVVINLGIGTPEHIALASENFTSSGFTLTVESGAIGGAPAGGLSFGASINPHAIIDQASQFDFYDGGGIDIAFLGFGEVDSKGAVNVGLLDGKINGVGGFINISQSAKRLIFCGCFTAGGLEIDYKNGLLEVVNEGKHIKFKDKVTQVDFNSDFYLGRAENVLYITERAVFELIDNVLVLIEVAPGIDITTQILNMSNAFIRVSEDIKIMEESLFVG